MEMLATTWPAAEPLAPLLATIWPAIGPLMPLLALLLANWVRPVRRLLFRSLYARILQDIADDLAREREAHRRALAAMTAELQRAGDALGRAEHERDAARGEISVLREQNRLLRTSLAQRERELAARNAEIAALRHEAAQRETEIRLLRGLLAHHAPSLPLPTTTTASHEEGFDACANPGRPASPDPAASAPAGAAN